MFDFFSNNIYLADVLDGFYDIHSHLLPAVDDGSPDQKRSIELLERMHDMGLKGIYLTPHIIYGAYNNLGEADLREKFASFAHGLKGDVRLAAEYFIDDKLLSHLEGQPLTMSGNHILAEFSMNGYSLRAFDVLFEATLSGFEMIIAHPERYTFVQADGKDKVINLIKQYKLQLNLLSLAGFHGSSAKKAAESMLDKNMYTFVGTDTHSHVYLDALKKAKVSRKVFDAVNSLKENNKTLF